jgi:hypothetical protein
MPGGDGGSDRRREPDGHPFLLPLVPARDHPHGILNRLGRERASCSRLLLGWGPSVAFHLAPVERGGDFVQATA